MSASDDDESPAASAAATPSRTANGASDLLDDADPTDAGVTDERAAPESEAAAIVSEAAALTPGDVYRIDDDDDDDEEDYEEEDIEESSGASNGSGKPNLSTVNAIVNQVMRQKERGGKVDVASIASKEVDRYYSDGSRDEEDEDAEYGLPPRQARPPSRDHRPWKMSPGSKKASKLIGSKIKGLKGSLPMRGGSGKSKIQVSIRNRKSNNGADGELEEWGMLDAPSSSPPKYAFRGYRDDPDEEDPNFEDLCDELGVTPDSRKKSWKGLIRTHSDPRRLNIIESTVRSNCVQYLSILFCLIGTAAIITWSVQEGMDHAKKTSQMSSDLTPKNVKDEEAKKDKEWWAGDHNSDADGVGMVDGNDKNAALVPVVNHEGEALTEGELEKLYYDISDAYLPIWFDRTTGWRGTTYREAMKFCKSHDDFVPCPYEVYCPGMGSHILIFNEVMEEEGLSWAPILDTWNEWVQVGSGGRQCEPYSAKHHERPDWGSKQAGMKQAGSNVAEEGGGPEELTRHVMCCLEKPLGDDFEAPAVPAPPSVEKEHGEGVDEPMLPPPPQHDTNMDEQTLESSLADQQTGQTTGSEFTLQQSTGLTKFDEDIKNNYRPFWFDNNDGWRGTTWDDGKAFCNSIPNGPHGETFHLCPTKAYCPNGPNAEKPLAYQMDAFGEGQQWAPVSNSLNGWVMVGKPSTCMTYMELNHVDPAWGRTGSEVHSKLHILCCQVESGFDGGITKGDVQGDAHGDAHGQEGVGAQGAAESPMQGMPNDIPIAQMTPVEAVDSPHNGAGNSSPHAGEHTFDDAINNMKKTLHPTWYSSVEGGWNGGTHVDALEFCKAKGLELCPLAALCPHGPTEHPLEGAWLTDADEPPTQWAPVINRPNKWILIGTEDGNESTSCMDYDTLNGVEPSWGLDGSMQELKRHILCCSIYSATSQTEVDEESAQEPDDSAPASEGGIAGTWFHAENGWNGGSHDDAEHFCALKEVNHKRMELCPYDVYCPQGPMQPPADGHGKIGEGEEHEQWAPTSNGDNQWIMVGMHGHNTATQCLTHGQLNGAAPEWGLDGTNKEKKRHIMCCTPSQ